MNEVRIDIQGGHRRCPFCRSDVRSDDQKAVCDSCLALHHHACWDEHGRCATCQGALVLAAATEPSPAPESAPSSTRRPDRFEQARELGARALSFVRTSVTRALFSPPPRRSAPAPVARESIPLPLSVTEPRSPAERAANTQLFTRAKDSDRYRSALTVEAIAQRRASLLEARSRNLDGRRPGFEAAFIAVASIIWFTVSPIITMLGLLTAGAHGFLLPRMRLSKLEAEARDWDLSPFVARLRELDQDFAIFEFDPSSTERPESCVPLENSPDSRLIGLTVDPTEARGHSRGSLVLLTCHEGRALTLEALE